MSDVPLDGNEQPVQPDRHAGVDQAIALLTVVLADDLALDAATIDAVAPDLDDPDQVEDLIRGLAELSAWLVMNLEELSDTSAAAWLRLAALEFAQPDG